MNPQDIVVTVENSLRRAQFSKHGVRLIVAVSGGADSMALLHSLFTLKKRLRLDLYVAHLNHNFRGREAIEDANFVKKISAELGLGAVMGKADPSSYRITHKLSSLEQAAREVRYEFLANTSREKMAEAIALGHTSDDQAETIIMHILRGSGIQGLRGMQELTAWADDMNNTDATLFRPLLTISRQDTERYCQELGVAFRNDSSNNSTNFTRNRLRHELLPVLESYNPRVKIAINRMGRSMSLTQQYLEEEISYVWGKVGAQHNETLQLDIGEITPLHPLVQRLILRRAYQEMTGNTNALHEIHLIQMESLLSKGTDGVINLPKGLILSKKGRILVLSYLDVDDCPYSSLGGKHAVKILSISKVPGWNVESRLVPLPSSLQSDDPLIATFDFEKIGTKLTVRNRINGDRFNPLGMSNHKKLQDFLVDNRIPRPWRDKIPLLISDLGIVWVVGYRIAEWAKVSADTRKVLRIRFKPTNT